MMFWTILFVSAFILLWITLTILTSAKEADESLNKILNKND